MSNSHPKLFLLRNCFLPLQCETCVLSSGATGWEFSQQNITALTKSLQILLAVSPERLRAEWLHSYTVLSESKREMLSLQGEAVWYLIFSPIEQKPGARGGSDLPGGRDRHNSDLSAAGNMQHTVSPMATVTSCNSCVWHLSRCNWPQVWNAGEPCLLPFPTLHRATAAYSILATRQEIWGYS